MSAAIESPLQATGFRWLLLYRICTLLSYQIVAVTVGCMCTNSHAIHGRWA